MRETQLTADVELLATSETSKSKQHTRPPISWTVDSREYTVDSIK